MVLLDMEKFRKKVVTRSNGGLLGAKKVKEYVVIDYPKDGDKILPHQYTIRIGASEGNVEISIDDQPWQPCRKNQGYSWFDWQKISLGMHTCIARKKLASGKYKKSKVVRCMAVEKLQSKP